MSSENNLHVHFMGICGSGCASVAMLASDRGYRVSGCDVSTESYYANELKKKNIQIFTGHDAAHLTEDVDIVAVSPAIFDIAPDNEELLLAKEKGILMTWQEFTGHYLQRGMNTIAIAGTHGKTTTTFITSEILIEGGLEPNVIGGSVYKKWGNGGRSGKSDLFVIEADEFNRNFHNYHPETAVLNNVEMDHPECYNSYDELIESFEVFLKGSDNLKTVILNGDSKGAMEVFEDVRHEPSMNKVRFLIHTRYQNIAVPETSNVSVIHYHTTRKTQEGTEFTVTSPEGEKSFRMKLFGEYNVSNAVSAILISRIYGVSDEKIQEGLLAFEGVGRRFDPVGTCMDIPVYDDYAHHPTEISSVLTMTKEYFPEKQVIAVFEPHQVSRLRLMFDDYVNALTIADRVVIAKTHLGREIHRDVHPITKEEWENASSKIHYEEDNERIRDYVENEIRDGNAGLIIVIGAANSYKISRLLCED